MQDYNGNRPFIIEGKRGPGGGSRGTMQKTGVSGRFLARLALLLAAVIAVACITVFKTFFTVKAEGRTYYAVCFYDGQSKSQAESVRDSLVASGGSGYIVSGGAYRVYGGVYLSGADAENVAAKENGAVVSEIGWNSRDISFSSYNETKIVGEALAYFTSVSDSLVKMSLDIGRGEESALAAGACAAAAEKRFSEYSVKISDENISLFFSRAAYAAGALPSPGDVGFLSGLRYVSQDLIMLRASLVA